MKRAQTAASFTSSKRSKISGLNGSSICVFVLTTIERRPFFDAAISCAYPGKLPECPNTVPHSVR